MIFRHWLSAMWIGNPWRQGGLSEGQQRIRDAFDEYGVSDYVVLEKGDTDIAVVGVFGKDALACAPTCELFIQRSNRGGKRNGRRDQENEDVDMIVCASHSGTWEDESKSEDENLAKAVPELDLDLKRSHTYNTGRAHCPWRYLCGILR